MINQLKILFIFLIKKLLIESFVFLPGACHSYILLLKTIIIIVVLLDCFFNNKDKMAKLFLINSRAAFTYLSPLYLVLYIIKYIQYY